MMTALTPSFQHRRMPRNRASSWVSLVGLVVLATACGARHRPAETAGGAGGPAPVSSGAPSAAVATTLPPGWAWPFDATQGKTAFSSLGVERPFDLAKISSLAGSSPCAPFEAAPHVWVAPLCEVPRLFPKVPNVPTAPLAPFASASLAAEPPFTGVVPLAADLRANGTDGPVQNQQMVGVCWTFAVSTVMENAFRRQGRSDLVAPMHILSSNVFNQIWKSGKSTALIGEGSWPYDPVKACKLNESPSEVWCGDAYKVQPGSWKSDAALTAEKQHADEGGLYRLVNARELTTDATLPLSAAAAISKGLAVYVGMKIDTNTWGYQRVKDGRIPDWTNGAAGHAVVLVAYRTTPTGREFLVHNSWGEGWGDKGYAWMSERMLVMFTDEALLFDAEGAGAGGELPKPTGGGGTLPIPIPTGIGLPLPIPAPSTSACPSGQTKDVVFGQCAKACSGGGAPVAGICTGGGAPMPAPKIGCAAGQVPDWITGKCVSQCPSGQPPIEGLCFP